MFERSGKKTRSPDNSDIITRDHALECVPVRNPEVDEQEKDNGELILNYQVRIRPWFQSVVQKITGRAEDIIKRKLELDALGATVWGMIDGQRKVRELIDDFQKMHQLNRREAEISVTTFLKELGKRGLIVMR
jgi:hypothetical protein